MKSKIDEVKEGIYTQVPFYGKIMKFLLFFKKGYTTIDKTEDAHYILTIKTFRNKYYVTDFKVIKIDEYVEQIEVQNEKQD